jgi:multisubunit Na+/H+ antiporter MnhE subunit
VPANLFHSDGRARNDSDDIRNLKRMRRTIVTMITLALSLAACATPEVQIRRSLVDAGLSAAVSACMAQRMADRLTIKQLLRLRALSSLGDKGRAPLTVAQYLHRARALGDPQILEITTSAAVRCALTR